MEVALSLKQAICALFEVHDDELGVQRVVTPLEFSGSTDRIVVRVRRAQGGFRIDENGEAALYASMAGGDVESESVERWAEELATVSPVVLEDDLTLVAHTEDARLLAPYVFRIAEAAQHLHALATARADRKASDFKERLAEVIRSVVDEMGLVAKQNVDLPIAGGLKADHVLGTSNPLIIIAASSSTRLMEAAIIHMQYRAEHKAGSVLAVAESQEAVGKVHFERSGYFTDKTVVFNSDGLRSLLASEAANRIQ